MSQLDTGKYARKQIKKIGLDQTITYDTQEGSTKFISLPPSTTRIQTKDYKYEGDLIQRTYLIYGKDPKNPIASISMTGDLKGGKFVASEVNKYDYDSSAKKDEQTKTKAHYVNTQRQKDVEKWESEHPKTKKDQAEAMRLAEKAREAAAAQQEREKIRTAEKPPVAQKDPTEVAVIKDHGKIFAKEPQTELWHKIEKGKMSPEKYALDRSAVNPYDPKSVGNFVKVESQVVGGGHLTYYRGRDGYNVYFDANGHQLKSAGEVLGRRDLENRYVLSVPTGKDEGLKHIELRSINGKLWLADTHAAGGGILQKEQLAEVANGQGLPRPAAPLAPAPTPLPQPTSPPAPAAQPQPSPTSQLQTRNIVLRFSTPLEDKGPVFELQPGQNGHAELDRLDQILEKIGYDINYDPTAHKLEILDGNKKPVSNAFLKLDEQNRITEEGKQQAVVLAQQLSQRGSPEKQPPPTQSLPPPTQSLPLPTQSVEQDYERDKTKLNASTLAQGQQYKSTETGRTYELGSDGKYYVHTNKPGGDIWTLPKLIDSQRRGYYIHNGPGSFEKAEVQRLGKPNQAATPSVDFLRSETTKRVYSRDQGTEVKPDKNGIYHFPNGAFAKESANGNLRLCDEQGRFLPSSQNRQGKR